MDTFTLASAHAPGPAPLLDSLVDAARVLPGDDAYALTRHGVETFLAELARPTDTPLPAQPWGVDALIARIDQRLSAHIDAILHHPDFQRLEAAWRGLRFLVDRTDFRENIRIELVSVSREALRDDFDNAGEPTRSALYKLLYTAEYGQFGGQPYAAVISDAQFGPGPRDMALLDSIARICAVAHAPFIAAAAPSFFGIASHAALPDLKDLASLFEGPQYIKWRAFRGADHARYVGLSLPSMLLRLPYGDDTMPTRTFRYVEDISAGNAAFLWGSAAFAFASRLSASFAADRWCANIIGPGGGGTVGGLPVYTYTSLGELQCKIPTEALISERREYELAEQGFIALTMRKNSDNAAFFSANSVQAPQHFGTSESAHEAELNHRLGTQLPYMFIVNRLAHYIKVIQRENIGTWKERADIENALNQWIRQYVADMDNPAPGVRGRRPLRQARILVKDVEGDPGWYEVSLQVRPHFKYMGASFTLSLVGRLDKQ